MTNNRADSFLRMIRKAEKGKLKIYLGYSAGVGKSYQMLMEGHRLKKDGIDVVVGFIETHKRAETEALVAGLEVIPRRKASHHGIEIEEMDLEAILERRPSVVLIDELAHTNVPGSKNSKRYQDVDEVLLAGIHVISALNIQHLESLYETVERATGVKVKERIPDRVVAEADQIVNVDVTTEDLRRRLKDGKIYARDRIETAMDNFFKTENLEQLRELALRELASQIDSRRRDPHLEEMPSSPDQVMVCLSTGPNNEALLRYASRLAGRLNRNWYAVYVQTSKEHPTLIEAETQRILGKTLNLAQQLGATVFTYKGDDVGKTILQFAKEYRVGHIVMGSPAKRLSFWQRLCGETSLVDKLIHEGFGNTLVILDTKMIQEALPKNEPVTKPNIQSSRNQIFEECKKVLLSVPIIIWEDVLEKEEAMRQLVEIVCQNKQDLKESAWLAILERELQGETFVGEDVALPHARIANIDAPIVGIGISKLGILDSGSNNYIRVMFLLLSPQNSPKTHLGMLSLIAKMSRDDLWRKKVVGSNRSQDILKLIQEWEEDHQSPKNN